MALLSVTGITKRFKDVVAVDHVSFEVAEGEFLSLLGPSGCGKTTTLRVMAGFEEVDAGTVLLNGKDVTFEPPFRRNTGMVFQNYALFPHMRVYDNVAFGLRMHKVDRRLIDGKVKRALDLVRLSGYGERYPRQLSGGQQQRVALARALVVEPALLLLDEPLSNLDAKLRQEMRIEIKLIQRTVGIATVFVTHDQEEALTMSDRIIVMEAGRITEMGCPIDIYQNPRCTFTAAFIGHANLFQGQVARAEADGLVIASEGGLQIHVPARPELHPGDKVLVVVKQERVQINGGVPAPGPMQNVFAADLRLISFLGPTTHYVCQSAGHEIHVRRSNEGRLPVIAPGEQIWLSWEPADCAVIAC